MAEESLAVPVDYAPSPNAFPPAPRKIRMRRPPVSSFFPLGCIGLFVVGGIASFFLWLGPALLVYSAPAVGTSSPGKITDMVKIGTRSAKHRISFTFWDEGDEYSTHIDARPEVYDAYKVGDAISVRFLRTAPVLSASIDGPHSTRTQYDLCSSLCILAWNGMIFSIAVSMVRVWLQRRKLAQRGTPTLGHVTNKQILHGKSAIFHITYSFRTEDGTDRQASMDVHQAAYDCLAVGQEVTILYDPANPQANGIYRCGEFDVLTSDDKTL